MAYGKTSRGSVGRGSNSRTVANTKKSAGRVKSGNRSGSKSYSPTRSTTNVGTPGKTATPIVATPTAAPVIPAGMPSTVATALNQKAAALKTALAAQAAQGSKVVPKTVLAPGVTQPGATTTKSTVAPIVKTAVTPSPYSKSASGFSKAPVVAARPVSGSYSGSGGYTSGGGGSSVGGGGSTTTSGSTPQVTPPTTVAPGVTVPTTTAPGATQAGGFNTRGARTYGQFNRKRQARGPMTGLSMTPEMLQRLAGQRITNPR